MKIEKKTILIFAVIIVIVGLAWFFTREPGNALTTNNINNNMNIGNDVVNNELMDDEPSAIITPLEKVTDYYNYFNIVDCINNYYSELTSNNAASAIGKLDITYRQVNDIDENSANDLYDQQYSSIGYYGYDMYVKGRNDIDYYFVEGNLLLEYSTFGTKLDNEKTYFLVMFDRRNVTYAIKPIQVESTLEIFANTYKMGVDNIQSNTFNNYLPSTVNEDKVLKLYLNYYKKLLYLDSAKAYDMLSDEMKTYYPTLEDFENNRSTIYKQISPNIIGYEAKGENGSKSYYSLDAKQNRILIQESSIMNFTVTIEQ